MVNSFQQPNGRDGDLMEYKFIEYMCSYCGRKETRSVNAGRPKPGTCSRKGPNKPHSWRTNRKY